jgi:hypothetical protein
MATTIHKNFSWYSITKNKWFNPILICSAFLGFFFTTSAFAEDLLGGALENIKANFGLGSVFLKVLYLMEIYYGWRKWRETHNPFAVGSIVLVALALNYAISTWVNK